MSIKDGVWTVSVCFTAGTPVWTKDGLKSIETIQIGEIVRSWDEKTGSFVEKKVTEQFVHEVPQLFDLELDGEEVIHTTWNHPIWVVGKKAWVKVMDLQIGDLVLLHDGSTVPVTGVHYYNVETTKVYNIEVEDTHAYLVGEHGVVVHNYAQDVGGIVGAVRSAVEELRSGLSDKESLQHDPEYVGKVTETIKRLSAYESESRHLDTERNELQKEQNKAKLKVDLAKNNNNMFLRAIRSSEADHIPGIKEIRAALKGSNGGEGFNRDQMQAIDKFVNGGLTNDALVRSGFRQGQVGFQEGFSGNRIAQERWKGFVLESAYNVKGSGEVAGAQRAISETSARIEERSQKISANESAVSKEIARSKEEMQTYLAGSKTAIESPEGRNRHVEDPKVKDGVSVAAKEPRENDPEQDRKNDAKERTKQNVEAAGYEATKHKEEEEESNFNKSESDKQREAPEFVDHNGKVDFDKMISGLSNIKTRTFDEDHSDAIGGDTKVKSFVPDYMIDSKTGKPIKTKVVTADEMAARTVDKMSLKDFLEYAKKNPGSVKVERDDFMGDEIPARIEINHLTHEVGIASIKLTKEEKAYLHSVDDIPFTKGGGGSITSEFQKKRLLTGGADHKGTDRSGDVFVNPYDLDFKVIEKSITSGRSLYVDIDVVQKDNTTVTKQHNVGMVQGKRTDNGSYTFMKITTETNPVTKVSVIKLKEITQADLDRHNQINENDKLTFELLTEEAKQGGIHSNGNSVTSSAVINGQEYFFTAKHIYDKIDYSKYKDGKIRKGENIGPVGSTGYSTGPHGHFEIYTMKKPDTTNPFLYHYDPETGRYYLHQTYFNRRVLGKK
ncbi:hypothetical protein EHO59_12820 [Leptospira semungkisensis]|uniref:Hint domain-containing protein n=1 Tax=Leptospira semungkisensis TaxID=2484985 RepID=A0A4R9FRK8_9LEPT|nr:polymorphic toxin-type HINT domain-containing protein [Leptospira semungkisensis]TGK00810.1 hypothetical protein EHO59_12820 [Leptospira semungkisensis]